jgi:hypothetical protein
LVRVVDFQEVTTIDTFDVAPVRCPAAVVEPVAADGHHHVIVLANFRFAQLVTRVERPAPTSTPRLPL